ncbi:hypothetical protein ONZ45_g5022 [Pleurotus djamor]|nr:hypothetical protein ONZ45_g5022 [Pleurotus djamor]
MKKIKVQDINSNDKIIALMGPTGAGKSTFIGVALNDSTLQGVGHKLNSFTDDVSATRYTRGKDSVVFVDTPGFDDTTRSDTDILKLIASWLEKTYKKGHRLAGILYLHRISDNRMAGSPLRNLHLFQSLCGVDPLKRVILVTTMWTPQLKMDLATARETELKVKFWKSMLENGSRTERFQGDFASAWEIVDSLLHAEARPVPVLLQEELVDLHKRLRETAAGRTLYVELIRLLDEQKATVEKLRNEAANSGATQNPRLRQELEKQLNQVDLLLSSTLKQVDEMKIPLLARVRNFFFGKRATTMTLIISIAEQECQQSYLCVDRKSTMHEGHARNCVDSACYLKLNTNMFASGPHAMPNPTTMNSNASNKRKDDVIIAVMGPTGVGKSTFISTACGRAGRQKTVGHGLESYTKDIKETRVTREGREIVLVDTPGFDDTHLPDTLILRIIAEWLKEKYSDDVKLAGIIYMHRVSDNRMAGSPLKNLDMFRQLCGTHAAQNVVLVTTMWSRVKPEVGQKRLAELKSNFWHGMIQCGADVAQFNDTSDSAWSIIKQLEDTKKREVLLLQEELVDLQKRLSETEAGKALYNTLQRQLDAQKQVLQQLEAEARKSDNPKLADDLKAHYEATQKQIEATFDQVKEMKISLTRRIVLFFNFRRARNVPIS